jgi:predicted alpha/beta superfamily hydrolase
MPGQPYSIRVEDPTLVAPHACGTARRVKHPVAYLSLALLVPVLSAAACAGGTVSTLTGTGAHTTGTGGSTTTAAGGSGTTSSSDTGGATGTTSSVSGTGGSTTTTSSSGTGATIRVHYPAGTHSITVRGSGAGLNWSTGQATSVSGDTFTYTLPSISSMIEWKPLLDDATWARGPNYHVSPGQTLDVWPHFTTITGQVQTLIPTFHSSNPALPDRPIYVYYPPSYYENTDATYPVVYMHDGQNLWAALPSIAFGATWNVDTTFDNAAESGACSSATVPGWGAQPFGGTPATCNGDGDCSTASPGACQTFPEAIVIGVANTGANRMYEYTPVTDSSETFCNSSPYCGGGDAYLTMLANELKPTIDGMLRTRPSFASTAMAGSSLGGLITAYAGCQQGKPYSNVYGLLAELSPSSSWANDFIIPDVQATPGAPNRPLVVYVDSAQGQSTDDETTTDMLAAAYLALGYVDGTNFRHVVQPAPADHEEKYWAQRFPGAMQLVLGTR